MKFLTTDEFFGPSVNFTKAGMSQADEKQRKEECIAFVRKLNADMVQDDTKCLCLAISIFSLFARKVSFTQFNRFLAVAISHYIATKIAYRKPKIQDYEIYVHEKAPLIDSQATSVRLDFAQVKGQLHKEAVELELNILAVLQYDFDFVFPFPTVNKYFSMLKQQWNNASPPLVNTQLQKKLQ